MGDPEKAFKKGVAEMVIALNKTKINCSFSGTTLVFGLLINKTLWVGNVGDSRAVMARKKNGRMVPVELSRDHKPEDPTEKKRILSLGGRVHPIPGPPDVDCGPSRVWLNDQDLPGLAMSRSIGDNICCNIGVISEPEVKKFDITKDDLFAVWASDGVWEFLSNNDVLSIIYKCKSNLK